jgi:hypothetical protein
MYTLFSSYGIKNKKMNREKKLFFQIEDWLKGMFLKFFSQWIQFKNEFSIKWTFFFSEKILGIFVGLFF